jgi:large subunit ribosomal protein L44e
LRGATSWHFGDSANSKRSIIALARFYVILWTLSLNYPRIKVYRMKMQKEQKKFCSKCKTHTVQTASIYKKGKDRAGAQGARRHAEDKRGYGGQKFPELKRTAKTTKKITLKYTCKTCHKQTMKEGIRLRKLEIQP